MNVTRDELIRLALDAPPERLDAAATVLRGGENLDDLRFYAPSDPRLWDALNIPSGTEEERKKAKAKVWNLIRYGKLPTVKTLRAETGAIRRHHGYKIPHWGIVKYLKGVTA